MAKNGHLPVTSRIKETPKARALGKTKSAKRDGVEFKDPPPWSPAPKRDRATRQTESSLPAVSRARSAAGVEDARGESRKSSPVGRTKVMPSSKMDQPVLAGSMTALVTPFRDGEVDWAALEMLLTRQLQGGTDWLVPCGTTGETPTLDDRERARILEAALHAARGHADVRQVGVMAGTGCNCTKSTVEMTRKAKAAGADAALIVTPYYNRPTQEGLFRHFATVAETVELPIVLYNVPVRTGVNLSNDTVVRLRERFPHIVGLKDASGSVDGVTDLVQRSDITVLCGDDVLTWPMMSLGARGVISVLSNLIPQLMKSLVTAAAEGDISAANSYHQRVYALANGLGRLGPNPIPIKTAMAVAGLSAEEFRLPLCALDADGRRTVERLMRRHEMLPDTVGIS